MNITVESHKRVELVTVSGRIDSSNAADFDKALRHLYEENERYNLVLELSEVSYMSSAGLRAIVAALRACGKSGGNVALAKPSERIAEVLDLAGLESVFTIYDDVTSAVGSF